MALRIYSIRKRILVTGRAGFRKTRQYTEAGLIDEARDAD